MVLLLAQQDEKQFKVLKGLHQNTCVGIKEPQSEPLQDQIQAADDSIFFTLQVLEMKGRKHMSLYKIIYINGMVHGEKGEERTKV